METKGARGGVIPPVSNTLGGSRLSCGSLAESSAIDEFLSTQSPVGSTSFEKDKQLDVEVSQEAAKRGRAVATLLIMTAMQFRCYSQKDLRRELHFQFSFQSGKKNKAQTDRQF